MILYRPVGRKELALIRESGWRSFPPRLPEQPIFYPVLNFGYAEQIARDWNSTSADSDHIGFVTEFEVDDTYIGRFEVKVVGTGTHQELWVPAGQLEAFNRHILGPIRLVATYRAGARVDRADRGDS